MTVLDRTFVWWSVRHNRKPHPGRNDRAGCGCKDSRVDGERLVCHAFSRRESRQRFDDLGWHGQTRHEYAGHRDRHLQGHLGEARIYMMSYLDATFTFDVNRSSTLTALDRLEIPAGGYYPPTRFPFQSKSTGKAIRQPFSAVR
jgi:hypothetical protein